MHYTSNAEYEYCYSTLLIPNNLRVSLSGSEGNYMQLRSVGFSARPALADKVCLQSFKKEDKTNPDPPLILLILHTIVLMTNLFQTVTGVTGLGYLVALWPVVL